MDIATYRLNQPRGQCSENHLKCITRWKGRDGVTTTIIVQHTMDGHKAGSLYEDKPHKDLKWAYSLGPIQTRLEAFLGFLVKTKMKAYTKLTDLMCCQIVARKSVAPSSGDFRRRSAPRYACGQDQES